MTDNPDDFKPYVDDLYEECESCNGGVLRSAAFMERGRFYHSDCAGVWHCSECGNWNEKGSPCECGAKGGDNV